MSYLRKENVKVALHMCGMYIANVMVKSARRAFVHSLAGIVPGNLGISRHVEMTSREKPMNSVAAALN